MTEVIQSNNTKGKVIVQSQDKLFRELLSDKKDVGRIIKEMIIEAQTTEGKTKWNSKKEYKEITDNIIRNQENIINAKYILMDIHNYQKEDLIKDECIIKNVMAIGKCKTAEEVKDTLNYLMQNSKSKEKQYKIWKISKYILPKITEKKYIQKMLEKIEKEEIEMFGMLEANLKKEKEEIIRQARKEGRKELIRNMIKEKISIETISKVTNLSKEEIENYL